MKLLVNAISAKRGGIVTYTRSLIGSMRQRRIDALFALPESFDVDGPDIIRARASEYGPAERFVWEQTAWRRIVGKVRPDLLFSSANFGLYRSPVPQVLLIREGGLFDPFYLTNVAPVQGVTTAAIRYWRRKLILASAQWADLVLTPTAAMRDYLLQWGPALDSKIEVCSYGTKTDLFTPARHHRPWRGDGQLRLIYVSVYYPHKNPGVICEALHRLNGSGLPARATVTMTTEEVAQTRGGALDAHQLDLAVRRGEVELGARSYDALPDIYGQHDVFVFPSVSETFGHPMAEAMSSGLPVVAADHPVNREVCGDAALYFSPFSPSDLVARLHELDGDPGLRQRLAERGRNRSERLFRWNDHVDHLVAIFERIAARARPVTPASHA